jgi:hypothetical protein
LNRGIFSGQVVLENARTARVIHLHVPEKKREKKASDGTAANIKYNTDFRGSNALDGFFGKQKAHGVAVGLSPMKMCSSE